MKPKRKYMFKTTYKGYYNKYNPEQVNESIFFYTNNTKTKNNYTVTTCLEHANGLDLPKLLVGSKSDLMSSSPIETLVSEEKILDFIQEKNMNGFFKTSSLQNQNVLSVFKELNNLMLKHLDTQYIVC